jgi:ligand-binding sensor domain-containing protein/signal transduction histidine kinase
MPNQRWVSFAAGLLFLVGSAHGVAQAPAAPQPQTPFAIDVWGTDDGLPQNSVLAMIRTRDGYLWLGTLNGLVRFDGVRFTVFDKGNTPGLKSSRILSLFEDSQGNLWIGTETAGVTLVKGGRLTSLDIGRGTGDERLVAACEDATGAVWLYTADGQLCRHREGRVDVWNVGADTPSSHRALIAEQAGLLWVGIDWRQIAIDPAVSADPRELRQVDAVPLAKLDYLLASQSGGYWRLSSGRLQKCEGARVTREIGRYPWDRPVTTACEDLQGNLIVGTAGAGLFWFDSAGQVTVLSTNQGLSYSYVRSLLMDGEGTLWVGTDGGGLNRVKRQVFDVLKDTRGLVVQSVCEDDQGALWIGYNGGGADRWSAGAVQRFGPEQGLPPNLPVRAVFVDRDQRVLVGTWGAGLFQLQEGRFRRVLGAGGLHPVVLAIYQDRAGRLWVGTQGGLARREERSWKLFTKREGLKSDVVRALAEDADGNLWVGTAEGGLHRLRDDRLTALPNSEVLPKDDVSSLHADADGVMWIGTDGSGLFRFERDQWTRFTTREGLVSDSVGYLLEDGQTNLWIGSHAGLLRAPKGKLNDFARGRATFVPFRAYGKLDGLPTRECTLGSQPAAWRTRDGKLWFPTIKGLASVDPTRLHLAPNTNPPPVVIESVLIDGQPQTAPTLRAPPPQAVSLRAGQERLEIQFTSLNLAAPDRARFRYRLEGHEKDWTDAGNSRFARYSRVPPGEYHFQVTACNEDGVWNPVGSSLALIVEPPFWRTWWFLTATASGLLGSIVALVHYFSTQKLQRQLERMRQQQALETERARIARDMHDQLGANLTQVALLGELVESDKHSPEEVAAHARQISQTARDTTRALDEIVWAVNPSNDTLDGLITYICKYAQEYLAVAGLRYRLEVPSELPAAPLPPEVRHNVFLAAKEAVNNVVRHAGAASVWLRLRLEPRSFTVEIQDDGRGIGGMDTKAAQSRNGLRNMRRRMEDIGGAFSIEPGPQGGTRVCLTAPVNGH